MTDLRFDVPVIAHRLFGTRLVERLSETGPRLRSAGSSFRRDLGFPRFTDESVLYPTIDRDHGSTTSVETIRAIFTEDLGIEGSNGLNVNSIWEPTGIRFVLLAIVDEVVDSYLADLVPRDTTRYFKDEEVHEDLVDVLPDPLNFRGLLGNLIEKRREYRDAVHMIFARDLEGRNGEGHSASKYKPAWILLPDFWTFRDETPEERWQRWMTIVAHEFGHVLKLPHMPGRENVMWWAASRASPQMKITQTRVAQEAASRYVLPPGTLEIAPYLGVEEGLTPRL